MPPRTPAPAPAVPPDPRPDPPSGPLPVVEERLDVERRRVTTGTVRIERRVEHRDVIVDEPLQRETVTVERVPVGRTLADGERPGPRRRGADLVVPIVEERLVVRRVRVLVAELHVRRVRETFRAPQRVSLARTQVRVRRDPHEAPAGPRDGTDPSPVPPTHEDETMSHTLVAMFADRQTALRARDRLRADGFPDDAVALRSDDGPGDGASSSGGVGAWFRSLFGMDDDDPQVRAHADAVRRGATMLSVDAPDVARAERAFAVLDGCGAIDLDERISGADATGTVRHDATGTVGRGAGDRVRGDAAATGAGTAGSGSRVQDARTIPVVEEELAVGKRVVQRGGVRLFTRVVERPVEEQVRLREEHAEVRRRPVDRPATEADLAAARDGTIELRETAEEPVVSKRARVVEEVDVGRRVTERAQTVRDTVRRTEVDVDPIDGTQREHAAARRDRDVPPPAGTGRREG